ncbi:MAG: hypothetical protein WKF75_20685 [Singulisphaera sp.]
MQPASKPHEEGDAVGMSGKASGDLVARGRRDVLAAAVLWSLSGVSPSHSTSTA